MIDKLKPLVDSKPKQLGALAIVAFLGTLGTAGYKGCENLIELDKKIDAQVTSREAVFDSLFRNDSLLFDQNQKIRNKLKLKDKQIYRLTNQPKKRKGLVRKGWDFLFGG